MLMARIQLKKELQDTVGQKLTVMRKIQNLNRDFEAKKVKEMLKNGKLNEAHLDKERDG